MSPLGVISVSFYKCQYFLLHKALLCFTSLVAAAPLLEPVILSREARGVA
jgi:hypothetical protein